MKYTAQQIAKYLNGKVEGNPKVSVSDISKIEEGRKGTLSFLANPKYTHYLYETQASIVLVNKDFELEKPVKTTIIRVDDAYQAVANILKLYNQNVLNKKGKESPHHIGKGTKLGKDIYIGSFAYIGDNVKIGKNCKIYPHTFIGDNVSIGDDVTLYPGVKIYHSCKIGNRCMIHAGTVIGSDGFGFAPDENNKYHKIEQVGIVVVKDDVEIGANTAIDRATMGETIIEAGVKLDNLIQVAHNVVIGENTVSASQAGISGTSKIGKNCALGGQVGISGHIKIGDNVQIAAKAGVPGNVESGQKIMGIPAVDAMEFKRNYVSQKRIPELNKKIKKLEKELQELKSKI